MLSGGGLTASGRSTIVEPLNLVDRIGLGRLIVRTSRAKAWSAGASSPPHTVIMYLVRGGMRRGGGQMGCTEFSTQGTRRDDRSESRFGKSDFERTSRVGVESSAVNIRYVKTVVVAQLVGPYVLAQLGDDDFASRSPVN